MKLKTFCFNGALFKNLLRRAWWIGFIEFIILFFAMPVPLVISVSEMLKNKSLSDFLSAPEWLERIHEYINRYFTPEGNMFVLVLLIACVLGAVCGVILFSYLMNKKQASFYHSQPVLRKTMFLNQILVAVIYFALAYIANLILQLIAVTIMGYIGAISFVSVIYMLFNVMVAFGITLAFSTLAAMLCGTVFAQIEMLLILLFLPTLSLIALTSISIILIPTFESGAIYSWLTYISPMVHIVAGAGFYALIVYVLLAIFIFALSLLLYRKRAIERAGNPIIHQIVKPIVRVSSCIVFGLLFGVFFAEFQHGLPALLFFCVAGALLCHMFCQGQFDKDFRAMFKNIKSFAVLAVVMVGFILALAFDVIGFNSFVPPAQRVKAVEITIGGDYEMRQRIFHIYRLENSEIDKSIDDSKLYEMQNISSIVDMADSIVNNKNYNGGTLLEADNPMRYGYNMATITVTYHMQGGFKRTRTYKEVDKVQIMDQLKALNKAPEYVQKHIALKQQAIGVEPREMQINSINVNINIKKAAEKNALLKAYCNDVLAHGIPLDSASIAAIYVNNNELVNYNMKVYNNYTQTIDVIKELGRVEYLAAYQDPKERQKIAAILVRQEYADEMPAATSDQVGKDLIITTSQMLQAMQLTQSVATAMAQNPKIGIFVVTEDEIDNLVNPLVVSYNYFGGGTLYDEQYGITAIESQEAKNCIEQIISTKLVDSDSLDEQERYTDPKSSTNGRFLYSKTPTYIVDYFSNAK